MLRHLVFVVIVTFGFAASGLPVLAQEPELLELSPTEQGVLRTIADLYSGDGQTTSDFGAPESPFGGPFSGAEPPPFIPLAETRLVLVDPLGDQRLFEQNNLGGLATSYLPADNSFTANSPYSVILTLELSEAVSDCGPGSYREAALFFRREGFPVVESGGPIPNDPGVGFAEAISLICRDGQMLTFAGRASGTSLGQFQQHLPAVEINAGGRHFVSFVLDDPTVELQAVTSFAEDTTQQQAFGFQRGPVDTFTEALAPGEAILGPGDLTLLGGEGGPFFVPPAGVETETPASEATPTATPTATATSEASGGGVTTTEDDGGGGSNAGVFALLAGILAAGGGTAVVLWWRARRSGLAAAGVHLAEGPAGFSIVVPPPGYIWIFPEGGDPFLLRGDEVEVLEEHGPVLPAIFRRMAPEYRSQLFARVADGVELHSIVAPPPWKPVTSGRPGEWAAIAAFQPKTGGARLVKPLEPRFNPLRPTIGVFVSLLDEPPPSWERATWGPSFWETIATSPPVKESTDPDDKMEPWRRIETMYRGGPVRSRFLENREGVRILGPEGHPLLFFEPFFRAPGLTPEKPRGTSLEETVEPMEILSDVGNF